MSKLLSLMIAAAFASVNVAAVAAPDATKKGEKKEMKAEKKDVKAAAKVEKKEAKKDEKKK